jgi:hypothetical protein
MQLRLVVIRHVAMRRIALASLLSLTGCQFAVKHPGVTTGIVAGSMSMGTCELASDQHAKCAAISGGIGLGLALIAGLVYLVADPTAEEEEAAGPPPPPVDWSKIPDTTPTPETPAPTPSPNPMPGDPGSGSGAM